MYFPSNSKQHNNLSLLIHILACEVRTQTKPWTRNCFISSLEDGNNMNLFIKGLNFDVYLKKNSLID